MFFDAYAALERIQAEKTEPERSAIPANSANLQRVDFSCFAEFAEIATHQSGNRVPEQGVRSQTSSTTSIGGRPVTWTGKVVSLAEWREMTHWERFGPDGRMFNGKTGKWE